MLLLNTILIKVNDRIEFSYIEIWDSFNAHQWMYQSRWDFWFRNL